MAAVSEKRCKRTANRRFRRRARLAVLAGREPPVKVREVVDVWDMAKDGRAWFGHLRPGPCADAEARDRWRRIMRK